MSSDLNWRSHARNPDSEEIFSKMCFDLLRELGFRVEHDLLIPDDEPGKPLKVTLRFHSKDILDAIPNEALRELQHRSVILITNSALSRNAERVASELNGGNIFKNSLQCLDQRVISQILVCFPGIYHRYFDKRRPTTSLDCSSIRSPNITCSLTSTSRFTGKNSRVGVHVVNQGPKSAMVQISQDCPGQDENLIEIPPFSSQEIILPQTGNLKHSYSWPAVNVSCNTPGSKFSIKDELPKKLNFRIDHVYVDPDGWASKIASRLEGPGVAFVAGGAGSGKSRLLAEATSISTEESVWIDLSRGNYGTTLIDSALELALGINILLLRSSELATESLIKLGMTDVEARLIHGYLRGEMRPDNSKFLVESAGSLVESLLGDKLIVIDNIHKLRYLDVAFIQELLLPKRHLRILCSGRSEEIEDQQLASLLLQSDRSNCINHVSIGSGNLRRIINAFVEEASADSQTRDFLRKFKSAKSMQQLMVSLKKLRASDMISHDQVGRLVVYDANLNHEVPDYKEALDAILDSLPLDRKALRQIMELAAVYGYDFDIDVVESVLGPSSIELLDGLEECELIIHDGRSQSGYRFDHELTHDVVRRSIPYGRQRRWHLKIAEYLEDPSRYTPESSALRLARHYAEANVVDKAALRSLEGARVLTQRGGFSEAQSVLEKIPGYCDQWRAANLSINSEEENKSYIVEAGALENIVDVEYTLSGSVAAYDHIRKLDALMLLYPASDDNRNRLEGKVQFYFARHHNLCGRNRQAENYMRSAIEIFEAGGYLKELGEALVRASTIQKNRRDFAKARKLAERAVDVFRESSNSEGLSQAYLTLGAAFLESGDPHKTVRFWKIALEAVQGSGADRAVCLAQIDYSYILALVDPGNPEIGRELEKGLILARRLSMSFAEVRSLLNIANWMYFHTERKLESLSLLDEASYKSDRLGDDYLQGLCVFSRLNLDERMDSEARHEEEILLERFILRRISEGGDLRALGDNRILNMIDYVESRALEWAGSSSTQLVALLERAKLDKEGRAIYKREGRCITLY